MNGEMNEWKDFKQPAILYCQMEINAKLKVIYDVSKHKIRSYMWNICSGFNNLTEREIIIFEPVY